MEKNIVFVGMGLASTIALPMILKAQGIKADYLCCMLPNEHPDQYRMMHDIEKALGIKVRDIGTGKTPLDIFYQEGFIGNSLHDVCSRILKREQSMRYVKENYPVGTNIYLGIGASEIDREMAIRKNWEGYGYNIKLPLIEMSWIDNNVLMNVCRSMFGYVPALYENGFSHGNCHGACIKSGIKQWLKLLDIYPVVYRQWEECEEWVREKTGKDVSILREMRNGKRYQLTLKRLREERTSIIWDDKEETGCSFCEAI